MDRVFIEQLSLKGKHGVGVHEREVEQEFLIDIDADFDTRKSALTDALKATVDYGRFRDIATDVVTKNTFYLIETLAERIAVKILEDSRIARVRVTVRKPTVYTNALPGVSITRERQGL
jgi:dihydroneopterin aldolase